MKQKLLLFLFSLLIISFSHARNDVPFNNWDDEIRLGVTVSLYPNPSSGLAFLEIESDEEQAFNIQVVNLIGQEILRQEVQTNQKVQLDLQNMPAGVYFVQIERGEEKVTKRLIIR